LQKLRLKPGQQVAWTNTPLAASEAIQRGKATADGNGLITLPQVRVGKQKNRVRVVVP
jgi:hypothetical protein